MSFFFKSLFSKNDECIKLIVFDFDGTLADTRKLLLQIIHKHLAKFNIVLTENLLKVFGNAPLRDYLSLAGIRNDLVSSVTKSIEQSFVKEYEKIKMAKNINFLSELDVKKVVVSNNNTEFIERVLRDNNIRFFEKVYGADHFTDKVHAIRSLCRKYKISTEEVIYVGDKDKDVFVAREVGCYSVIVSSKIAWSSRSEILAVKPDFLITDLKSLSKVVDQINVSEVASI